MEIEGKYEASGPLLRQGLKLDLAEGRFKKIRKAFGWIDLPEKWSPLPKLNYVLLFKTFYAKCEPCDLSEAAPGVYQVSLVYGRNRKLIVHEGRSFEEVKKIALQLSAAFRLKIRDAATNRRAPVWLPVQDGQTEGL